MLGRDIAHRLRRLVELRTERDMANQAYKALKKEYDALETELWDELNSSPMLPPYKIELDGEVITISPTETKYGQVLDKEKALEALAEDGERDAFVDEKIIAARLNEYVRDKLERGERLPDGIDFYSQRPISISRKPT